jgi:hypothetical protein
VSTCRLGVGVLVSVTLFVSHSFADGRRQAEDLVRRLENSGARVWAPTRQMRLGRNWLQQAGDRISQVDAVLLVMTPDALRLDSACRTECIVAQTLGTPVIPARMSDIDAHPPFVLPGVTWVDLYKNPRGYEQLEHELLLMATHGVHKMTVDRTVWEPGHGAFGGDGRVFVGRWLVKRRLRPGERMALIPDFEVDMQLTSRFWERTRGLRRIRMVGTWGFDGARGMLMFAQDHGTTRFMTVDTNHGPNAFAGETDGRRYVAERLLELD